MGLDWLTPEGLTRTHVSQFPVPQTASRHLVRKVGRTISAVEDPLGVIIGIIDDNEKNNQHAEGDLGGSVLQSGIGKGGFTASDQECSAPIE